MAPGSGRTRPMTTSWRRRAFRSIRGIGVRRVQDLPLKRWKRMGGQRHLHPALRHRGPMGLLRGRGPGRGRAQRRAPHVRRDHGRGRRPRHDRDLDRRSEEAAQLRVAARLDVLDPAQHLAPHRQCGLEPGAHPGRDDRAERDEPVPRHRLDLQLPGRVSRRASTAATIIFKPKDDIAPDPLRGLAMRKTNLIPDIFNAELYLDNRRSPGYKRMEPNMAGNVFYGFVGEHVTGRYSKAHAHMSSAVLVCINGKGYTYTWPRVDRHDAVEGRQDRSDLPAGLRAGRPRHRRALRRRLVPRPFRRSARSRCG